MVISRLKILVAYSRGSRWCVQSNITNLLGNCLFSFSTEKITGIKTYTEDLETKISTTFGAFGGKFGASLGYYHIEHNTEHYQNIFTETEASCCAYTAELYEFAHPKFHNNFIQGLNSLTEDYISSVYYRLV